MKIPRSNKNTDADTESSLEYSSSDNLTNNHRKMQISEDEKKTPQKSKGLSTAWEMIFRKQQDKHTNQQQIATNNTIRQSHTQTTIQNQTTNYWNNLNFGHSIEQDSEFEGFLFHKINGLKDKHNWMQINITMKDLNVTCFGFSELNTMTRGTNFRRWNDITHKTFHHSKMITSESDFKTETKYKQGSTMTTIIGKWNARVIETGTDPTGLGRWSFMIISSNKKS
jgi:hypothetical protein